MNGVHLAFEIESGNILPIRRFPSEIRVPPIVENRVVPSRRDLRGAGLVKRRNMIGQAGGRLLKWGAVIGQIGEVGGTGWG